MATDIYLCRRLSSFIPVDDDGRAVLAGVGQGEIIKAKVSKPRNPKFHRKFFSMISLVHANQERFPTIDHLLTAVKIEAGWYHDTPIDLEGRLVYVPKSISFARMDEHEFHVFYSQALSAVCRLLPHLNAEDIEDEVLSYAA